MEINVMKGKSSRRDFLLRGSASAIAAGTVFSVNETLAAPARYAQSLAMTAEGEIDFAFVLYLVPPVPPSLPPGFVPTGAPRARYTFPVEHVDVIETFVFLPGLLNGAPVEGPISLFYIAVDAVSISQATGLVDGDRPAGTFAMSGKVISNPVESPFGDLTGRSAAIASGFVVDQNGAATFKLLGGPIGGSHATFLKEATGELAIKRPWHSY